MKIDAPDPSRELLYKIKAHFVGQGKTLAGWCRDNKIDQSHARAAVLGTWDGPKGRAVRAALAKEAGITPPNKREKAAA